ncbi:MAG: hypothetical protein ACOC0U_06960 [Desulfovibrionales bacterium]
MGELLQIRVTAVTYRPEDVLKRWPKLAGILRTGKEFKLGVLELIQDISDQLQFGNIAEKDKRVLEEFPVQDLLGKKRELENALAERDPQKADRLSYILEDALDELEKQVTGE